MTIPAQTPPLAGRCIFLVEDDYFIAQALAKLLANAGATVLGPIGWADEALVYVREHHSRFDGAVLDINLHGEMSYPVVDALHALKVPVVLMTGYSAEALDARYRAFPRCEKPLALQGLLQSLIADAN